PFAGPGPRATQGAQARKNRSEMVRRQSRVVTLTDMALGLYVHIPFCSAICNYCNFNRGLFDADLKTRYVRALQQEIARTESGLRADTIFFGGGTPSLLESEEVASIIRSIRENVDLDQGSEITLETNPETVDRAK